MTYKWKLSSDFSPYTLPPQLFYFFFFCYLLLFSFSGLSVKAQSQITNYKFNFGENIETLEQKIQVACSHFGCSAKRLIYLAKCESTNNPLAINYREPGQPSGLFQHKIIYWPERATKYGIPGASVFDQDAQIWVTAQMFPKYNYLWAC